MSKRTTVQCNAQAHKVTDMFIYVVDCGTVSECNATKMNISSVDDFLYQLELGTEAVKAADDGGVGGGGGGGDDFEPKSKKKKISLSDYDDAEPDEPESVQHDNGLTWSIKTKFRVRGFHLIVCIARNEIGDSVTTKLILVIECVNQFACIYSQ